MENQRVQEGKHDRIALLRKRAHKNSDYALRTKNQVDKVDYSAEVKKFLKEVKEHQDRITRKQQLENNSAQFGVEDEEDHIVDTVIPVAVKPFLNKEINFDLFLEMLTDKVDK